jgi:hypothetical protein
MGNLVSQQMTPTTIQPLNPTGMFQNTGLNNVFQYLLQNRLGMPMYNTGGGSSPVVEPQQPSNYTGSQFGRDLGFGLANMPLSPLSNLIGEAILSNEIDAIDRSFDNLPETRGEPTQDSSRDSNTNDSGVTDTGEPTSASTDTEGSF